ncbi:hypothetical protein Plhal304r1_c049g0131681 [Plasmopara halstedii]
MKGLSRNATRIENFDVNSTVILKPINVASNSWYNFHVTGIQIGNSETGRLALGPSIAGEKIEIS